MPLSTDRMSIDAPAGVTIHRLGRGGAPHGALLDPAASGPRQVRGEPTSDLPHPRLAARS
ncbi:hypothetical protein [Cellulomonas uda]|uniref:Uncharacterized protein n=1 Tax=Cellulomonas uda TaxID=1714 RepID=A0A4Y3KCV4_CELUD|nr:hypothetical protein [Cellulomonas uda]NII66176.1 hypothetical protein [Cellulomonas uda]GEA80828.1 hypothetical protein CUD01_12720 [Cellulomonas uda]